MECNRRRETVARVPAFGPTDEFPVWCDVGLHVEDGRQVSRDGQRRAG